MRPPSPTTGAAPRAPTPTTPCLAAASARAEDELPEEDQFGRMKYLESCQALAISPASQILKFLESEEVHVVHYGLGLKGTQVRPMHACVGAKLHVQHQHRTHFAASRNGLTYVPALPATGWRGDLSCAAAAAGGGRRAWAASRLRRARWFNGCCERRPSPSLRKERCRRPATAAALRAPSCAHIASSHPRTHECEAARVRTLRAPPCN